ncbi:hypothetical protein GCM10025876_20730 [Demequina litorisediminis]|uniref:Uncharacterized protein n=1 Tax=Demequina litorisediminis TaxID=1849022 RepID=A0ABQ6IDT0_9MICO|nr:hypothetical protein GCM10025876_20730 [Demequina litorisediminis]
MASAPSQPKRAAMPVSSGCNAQDTSATATAASGTANQASAPTPGVHHTVSASTTACASSSPPRRHGERGLDAIARARRRSASVSNHRRVGATHASTSTPAEPASGASHALTGNDS